MRAIANGPHLLKLPGWSAPSSAQATIGPIDSGTAITCGSLTEALKQRKFDGDFNAMLTWWREHKNAEHLALAQAGGTSIPRRAPTTSQ